MTSLDDLDAYRIKPWQRVCSVVYGLLWALFTFIALSFLKLMIEAGPTKP